MPNGPLRYRNPIRRHVFAALHESDSGTYATFPDGRRKAGISPKPDIAGLLSMLVYEFTLQLDSGSAAHRFGLRRVRGTQDIAERASLTHSGHFSAESTNTLRSSGWAVDALHPVYEVPAV